LFYILLFKYKIKTKLKDLLSFDISIWTFELVELDELLWLVENVKVYEIVEFFFKMIEIINILK